MSTVAMKVNGKDVSATVEDRITRTQFQYTLEDADPATAFLTHVTEIVGMEGEIITLQDIFLFERTGIGEDGKVRGRFRATGIRPKCADRLAASGHRLPAEMLRVTTLPMAPLRRN
jgi:hypothetical protein